jgi:type VI secretion system protein ImpA
MADIDVDALLAPVSDASPSGADLEYDPAFQALEDAARGKAEQQFGETLIPAQDPDWRTMKEQALELFQRTRDLRVAMQLLRAATRMNGFDGFSSGIRLVHGLLERQWDTVYPLLDASDNNDPTMRVNALAPLEGLNAVVADLRAAGIGPGRDAMTVRSVELAYGKADASTGEAVPSEAGAIEAVKAAAAQAPQLLDALIAAQNHVRGIEAIIGEKVGASQGPDLKLLRTLTHCLAQVAQAVRGESGEASSEGATSEGGTGAPRAGGAPGTIASRDDAIKALDRVCVWIERNEPTNPAPLLIRRAQRLMGKSFMDIIRDLAPEGLSQVERIAGVDSE